MRQRSQGRWQFRVYEGCDPISGKDRYRTASFEGTKRQAQSELARLVAEVDAGVVTPVRKTVATLLEEWLDHIEHLGRSPSTLFGYRRLVGQLPDGFNALPLKKVTPKVIDDLYASSPSPSAASPLPSSASTPFSAPPSPKLSGGAGSSATPWTEPVPRESTATRCHR